MATEENLTAILQDLPPHKQTIATGLIGEVIFMQNLLQKLKSAIDTNGVLIRSASGVPIESPHVKSYNATLKNYSNVCTQLIKLVAGIENTDKSNALRNWLEATRL